MVEYYPEFVQKKVISLGNEHLKHQDLESNQSVSSFQTNSFMQN